MKPYLILGMLAAVLLLLCACGGRNAPEVSGEPKELAAFSFTKRGAESSQCVLYSMEATEDGVRLYTEGLYSGGPVVDRMADEAALTQLAVLVRNHRLDRWDGFSQKAQNVSDGTGFTLCILFSDGTSVSAEGNNRFPDGYAETEKAICELFEYLTDRYGDTAQEDGGHTIRTDPDAPKTIVSEELVRLSMEFYCSDTEHEARTGVYAFELKQEGDQWELSVAKCRNGTAVVDSTVPARAETLIREYNLISLNGLYDVTAALPVEYMPCSVSAEYASGEILYFTQDGDPETEWYRAFRDLFLGALAENGYPDFLPPEEAGETAPDAP